MKTLVCFLSVLAGFILSDALSTGMSVAAENESSEMERIIGGRDAEEGQFPYAVSLYSMDRLICTGSIIGRETVLTAAHCVVSNGKTGPPESFHAIANVNRTSPRVRLDFTSVIPHPEYSEIGLQNDIAVLKTTKPIAMSHDVKPICIAHSDTAPEEYEDVIAMGWGDTSRSRVFPRIPEILQYIELSVVGTSECVLGYIESQLEDYKICAGDLFSKLCYIDAGGPLVFEGNGTVPVQLGVATYGVALTGCGFLEPSTWTRVSSFNGFIKKAAAGDELCEV